MPTDETVNEVHAQQLPQRDTQISPSIRHDDSSRNVVTIINLILVLLSPKNGEVPDSGSRLVKSNLGWVLDCLARVWEFMGPGEQVLVSRTVKDHCYSPFLKALCMCLQPASPSKCESIESISAAVLVCRSIEFFLQLDPEGMTSDLEIAICWSIYDLLAVGNRCGRVLEIYQEHLGSVLQLEDEPQSWLDSLSYDLQVRTPSLCIRTLKQSARVGPRFSPLFWRQA